MPNREANATAGRTLWLLRHAKTVTDPPPGGVDFDRVLAPRGRRDATALGRLFAGAGDGLGPALQGVPRPQIALGSPAARTAATAELVLADVTDPRNVAWTEPSTALIRRRCSPSSGLCPTTPTPPWSWATTRRHRPSPKACCPLATRRGAPPWCGAAFPTCALGVYAFDVDRWADVAAGTAKLVAIMAPPYARPRASAVSLDLRQGAENGGVTLAATTAQRHGRRGGTPAAQLEQRRQRHPGPGHADRVARARWRRRSR